MAGYSDTRQLIIDTLMGRPAGTEIQPEDHQAFALQITDYVRAVELVAGNATPIGFADASTVPVQPDNGQAVYLSQVNRGTTVTFTNFIDQNGNAISVTSDSSSVTFVTLLWNGQYWSKQTTVVSASVLTAETFRVTFNESGGVVTASDNGSAIATALHAGKYVYAYFSTYDALVPFYNYDSNGNAVFFVNNDKMGTRYTVPNNSTTVTVEETGISILKVTFTYSGSTITSSENATNIRNALLSGKYVYAYDLRYGITVPLKKTYTESSSAVVYFETAVQDKIYTYLLSGDSTDVTANKLPLSGIIDCNKISGYDYSSIFTLSEAIAAVPSELRYTAKGVTYLSSSGVQLALFNDTGYVSNWENTSKWFVITSEIQDLKNKIGYFYCPISSKGTINFNNTSSRVEFSQIVYITTRGGNRVAIPAGNVSYNFPSSNNYLCLVYNDATSAIEFYGLDQLTENHNIICTFNLDDYSNVLYAFSLLECRVDGNSIQNDITNLQSQIVNSRGTINFNNTTHNIEVPYAIFYRDGGTQKSITAGNYSMDMSSVSGSYGALCINKTSQAFVFRSMNTITSDDIVIAAIIKATDTTMDKVPFSILKCTVDSVNDITNLQSQITSLDTQVTSIEGELYPNSDSIIDRYGNVESLSGYSCTNFLPIDTSDNIDIHGSQATSMQICDFFDVNGAFISTYRSIVEGKGETMPTGNDVTVTILKADIPSNAVYIRCTKNNSVGGYVKNNALSIAFLSGRVKENNDENISLQTQINTLNEGTAAKAYSLETEWKCRENYLRGLYHSDSATEHWYGAEWTEESNSSVTAINSSGDSGLHTSLPIQSKMKRCVVKNGVVQYYLNDNNSELKADGTAANLDGTDGQVMVEIPEFFYRAETSVSNNVRTVRIKISEQGLDGFYFSPKRYTSAYEATINRTTSELASVCTTLFTRTTEEIFTQEGNYIVGTAYSRGIQKTALRNGFSANATTYRGGTNDSSLDNQTSPTDSNFARNQLGIPVANLNRNQLRNYSKPNYRMFIYQYDTQKILWILSMIEFKTKNIQTSALGVGATVYPSYDAYQEFFTPFRGISCIPCGVTNSLGNASGTVYFKMQNVPVDDDMTRGDVWMPCMSYRGVEHYYGHIYKIADQVNVKCVGTGTYPTGHEGDANYEYNNVTYSYQKNPYLVSDAIDNGEVFGPYNYMSGTQVIKSILVGDYAHILPIDSDLTGYSTYYCDCVEIYHRGGDNIVYPTFNGRIVSGNLCGSNFIVGADLVNTSGARPSDGTRLDIV